MKRTYSKALGLILGLGLAMTGYAQLAPGDIIFTGYNTREDPRGFSFMATTAIPMGTELHFTDNGVHTNGTDFRYAEGFITYTATTGLSAGDQVTIISTAGNISVKNGGGTATETGVFNIDNGSDQIILFTGTVTGFSSATVDNFITAIDFYAGVNDTSAGVFDADATNDFETAIPDGLTEGSTAIALQAIEINNDNGRLRYPVGFENQPSGSMATQGNSTINWEQYSEVNFYLPPHPTNIWDGTTWSSGIVPDATQHVVIDEGASFSIADTLTVAEFTLEGNGASLDLQGRLNIEGDFNYFGGNMIGDGTIALLAHDEENDFRGNALPFVGVVEVGDNTTLHTNERLRLISTSVTDYGQIITASTGVDMGTVQNPFFMQMYIDLEGGANDGRWYDLTSPLAGQQVNDFNQNEDIVVNGNDGTGPVDPKLNSVYKWDADLGVWENPTGPSEIMPAGIGYTFFVGSNAFGQWLRAEAGPLEVSGTMRSADVTVPLEYASGQSAASQVIGFVGDDSDIEQTRGWNFLGNPFTTQYTIAGQAWDPNVNSAIYIWNNEDTSGTQEGYAVFISGVQIVPGSSNTPAGNRGQGAVAPFQGFWIQTVDSVSPGTFTFDIDQRTTDSVAEFFKAPNLDGIYLNASTTERTDEIYMGFDGDASMNFDRRHDAWKLFGDRSKMHIYTRQANKFYSVQRVHLANTKVFDLSVDNKNQGETIDIEIDNSELRSYAMVTLEDLKTGAMHDLTSGKYTYANDTAYGPHRFKVHFSQSTVDLTEKLAENDVPNWFAFATENGAIVKNFNMESPRVEVYSITGQLLYMKEDIGEIEQLPLERGSGVHVIRLIDEGQVTTQKIVL